MKGDSRYNYEYDENGNLVKKTKTETWEYSYDLLNQLEQVKKNGEIVSSYTYDPTGFRVIKQGTKGTVHYVPLLKGEVGYRKELNQKKEYSFIYVGGQHLARVNGVIGGDGKKFFYHNDHQGSALVVTDENGEKVVERDFTPFGERINTDVNKENDPNRAAEEDESGFTGKDYDDDIGLYYYNARWYDPTVGRFITEDSVDDGPNEYGYCGQNPVNNVDPTGHFSMGPVQFVSGTGLVGATLSAAAMLTGDKNLATLSSAFSLFVAVNHYLEVKQAERNAKLAMLGEKLEEERASVQEAALRNESTSTGSQEATQPPPAEEPPKNMEEIIQRIEPTLPEDNFKDNFDEIIGHVLNIEGGFIDHPNDEGGATNRGVTFKIFQLGAKKYLGIEPTLENLKKLTVAQAKTLYRKMYWDPMAGAQIKDKQVAHILFDMAVNSGVETGIRYMQKTLNKMGNSLVRDGIMGPNTLNAINNADGEELFNNFKTARINFYKAIIDADPTQKVFEKGWMNRINSFIYSKN